MNQKNLEDKHSEREMSSLLKIGFLGGGKMAQAMAKGFIAAGMWVFVHYDHVVKFFLK